MKNAIVAEIPNIPKPVMADIIASSGLADLSYEDGDLVYSGGMVLSEEAAIELIQNYVKSLSESEARDSLTLEVAYVVSVTDIVYDTDDSDGLPSELVFVFYSDEVDEDAEIDSIHAIVDDKISDETGFCFNSCALLIQKYTPYQGVKEVE